jgi:hypothetical protein
MAPTYDQLSRFSHQVEGMKERSLQLQSHFVVSRKALPGPRSFLSATYSKPRTQTSIYTNVSIANQLDSPNFEKRELLNLTAQRSTTPIDHNINNRRVTHHHTTVLCS